MKDATIMLRVTSQQKLAIKRMARQHGMTITEFMLLNMMKSINKSELEIASTVDIANTKKTN